MTPYIESVCTLRTLRTLQSMVRLSAEVTTVVSSIYETNRAHTQYFALLFLGHSQCKNYMYTHSFRCTLSLHSAYSPMQCHMQQVCTAETGDCCEIMLSRCAVPFRREQGEYSYVEKGML